jgi:multicomponent Na+:H+ antiporter subunit F
MGAIIFLAITISLCMVRVIKGPTRGDRIIGINIIGTKTIVIIALISFLMKEVYFIDVVLVYALISFVGSFAVARELDDDSETLSDEPFDDGFSADDKRESAVFAEEVLHD